MEETAPQAEMQSRTAHLKPFQWKKGQSGNPAGSVKGHKSLKVFAREYLQSLPDDRKIEYLESLPTDIVWKMAEGNPHSTTDNKHEVIVPEPIAKIVRNEIRGNDSIPENSPA